MNCYVTSPKAHSILPEELNKDNTLYYPESRMTTDQCFKTSRPSEYHIVTDSPFLISLYDYNEVFIWIKNKWINPKIQTYGTSYNIIISEIFDYNNSIPQAVINSNKVNNCMGYNIK